MFRVYFLFGHTRYIRQNNNTFFADFNLQTHFFLVLFSTLNVIPLIQKSPWSILGVANGTSKNVGLGKFWQDLEISEAFLISLEVSFLHGCIHFFESRNFLPKSLGLGFLTRISASRRVSDFTIRHPLFWNISPLLVIGSKENGFEWIYFKDLFHYSHIKWNL